jgi:hypothetical protein
VAVAGTSASSGVRTFDVDVSAPSIWIESGPSLTHPSGRLVGFQIGSDPVSETYQCQLDNRAPKPCYSTIEYEGVSSGVHTFTASLGTSSVSRSFLVDRSRPTVRLARIRPGVTHKPTTVVHWTSSDPAGVVKFQLRVKRAAHGAHMKGWTKQEIGTKTSLREHIPSGGRLCVSVRELDTLNNWSLWTTAQCVVRLPKHHH